MKKFIIALFIVFVFTSLLLPTLIPLNLIETNVSTNKMNKTYLTLINKNTNEVKEISLDEYVKGVLLADLEFCSFENETLKAKAIIVRTFALKANEKQNPNHTQYDLCTNKNCCLNYINEEDYYKKNTSSSLGIVETLMYKQKVNRAIKKTKDLALIYKGELITPYYHKASGEITENALEILNEDIPYLKNSENMYEGITPYDEVENKIKIDKFIEKLIKNYPDIVINKIGLKNQIKIISLTKGSGLKEIQIGNKIFLGIEIYNLFNLRSIEVSKIKITLSEVIFITKGDGLGLGLSEYGANGYAKKSYDYKHILSTYYKGIKIINIYNTNLFPNTFY